MSNTKKILEALELVLPMKKEDASELVSEFIELISEGFKNPTDAFIIAKKLNSIADDLVDYSKQFVDVEKEERHGVKLTSFLAGVRYDFTNCNHPEWNELNDYVQNTNKEMTLIEKELKSMKEGKTVVNEETGETFRIELPIKKGAQTIKFEWIE